MQCFLVIKPSSLGDIIHSLPFLNALRTSFADAHIQWIVDRAFEGLLKNHPMIDRLWVIDKTKWRLPKGIFKFIRDIARLSKSLSPYSFDATIDLQGLFRSGLLSFVCKSQKRIGLSTAREFSRLFYTDIVPASLNMHAVERNLQVAQYLGCKIESVEFPLPTFAESKIANEFKKKYTDYAVIIPGARKKANQWMPERFAELAKALPMHSVIIGSMHDIEIGQKIERLSSAKAISICGQTDMTDLFAIIKNANIAIGNDTGPIHIASALNVPVVGIFGPANPKRTGPYSKNSVVVKSDEQCAPCYKRHCPNPICLENVTVQMVLQAVENLFHMRVS